MSATRAPVWPPRREHNPFCSAAGWPCPIGCETWPECAAEMFPNLIGACPMLCPVHDKPAPSVSGGADNRTNP